MAVTRDNDDEILLTKGENNFICNTVALKYLRLKMNMKQKLK